MIGYKKDPSPDGYQLKIDNIDFFVKYGTYLEVREVLDGKRKGNIKKLIEKDTIEDKLTRRASLLINLLTTPIEELINSDITLVCDSGNFWKNISKNYNYLNLFPVLDKENMQTAPRSLRSVSLDILSAFFECLFKVRSESDESNNAKDVIKAIRKAGISEHTSLTPQLIYELLLFGYLFTYFRNAPSNDDIEHLRKNLEQYLENLEQYSVARRIASNEIIEISPARFVCYQKQETNIPLNLEIRTLHNKMDARATIIVDGSPLQRSIAPGEKLALLCVDGAVVTFMPRICVVGDCVITQNELLEMNNSSSKGSSLAAFSENSVLCFSESDTYGLMVTDENGKFISQNQFVGDIPEKDICWMKGDLEDYGFVLSDGTYTGRIRRANWKNILFFDLSGGNGIAVTAQRTAIDNDGRVLCEDVAAVSCCGKRYIILKMDGSVVTDQEIDAHPSAPICSVCADESGYWISTDKAMFRGASEKEFVPADEIMRNHVGSTVFSLDTDGKVSSLS